MAESAESAERQRKALEDTAIDKNEVIAPIPLSAENLPLRRDRCCCRRGDRASLLIIPCVFCVLLLAMLLSPRLWVIWLLNALLFAALLLSVHRFSVRPDGPRLDVFTVSVLFGAASGIFGWCFAWIMANANAVAVGPFLFAPSSFAFRSEAAIGILSTASAAMYGGVFPFLVLWIKCDRRWLSCCCCRGCKTEDVQCPKQSRERLLAQQDAETVHSLDVQMMRLRMECVATLCGMFLCSDHVPRAKELMISVFGDDLRHRFLGELFFVKHGEQRIGLCPRVRAQGLSVRGAVCSLDVGHHREAHCVSDHGEQ